jgi:pimeloyl-ACP methyl ester carboxylesterase
MKGYVCCVGSLFLTTVLPGCDEASDGVNVAPDRSVTASALHQCGSPHTQLQVPCEQLATVLQFPDTIFTSATGVATGELTLAGQDIGAHCLLVGKMHQRVSPMDGQSYAIAFEMRLPLDWNRRFFYQANGGIDGNVVTATGNTSGGGPLTSALSQGFAVISSDAGHSAMQNPTFGIDPKARLDYGYQAVGKLTPMAKEVIRTAYGRRPSHSYIGGCSNGGRHTMVAAARYADAYDGYLVGSPGFNLPKAAVASIYGGQQYAAVAGGATIPDGPYAGLPDLSAGFTLPERQLLSQKILERCDALDGAVDGLVQATAACQRAFSLDRDVPTCAGPRDGTCLSAAQKVSIGNIFAGPKDSLGQPIYSGFPFDAGLAANGSTFWEFISPLLLDSGAVGFIFGTPPVNPATFIPPLFALTSNIEQLAASTNATNATYTESAQSFMVPPDLERFDDLRRHGGRMIVYHGTSDPIFSADDTAAWYSTLNHASKEAVRLYLVPGMSHCSDGPATDQFDLLTPLVRWVEEGESPKSVVASARGPQNPGGANLDLPANWSTTRTRPLCAFPQIAIYKGGDVENAESFACRR